MSVLYSVGGFNGTIKGEFYEMRHQHKTSDKSETKDE